MAKLRSYNQLKAEFDKKVKTLQKRCKHKRTYKAEQWWAPGHSTGKMLVICEFCSKRLQEYKMGDFNDIQSK